MTPGLAESPSSQKDAYERAFVRIWSDHIEKKIIPPFYGILFKETEQEQHESKDTLINNIQLIMNAMSENGPFFLCKEFGMVDIMLFQVMKNELIFQVMKSSVVIINGGML